MFFNIDTYNHVIVIFIDNSTKEQTHVFVGLSKYTGRIKSPILNFM